jgi:hypothetical protein
VHQAMPGSGDTDSSAVLLCAETNPAPPAGSVESGNLSISGIISQAIAGGAGDAILTAIIGAIKNKAAA